jgi:hypothetical protein
MTQKIDTVMLKNVASKTPSVKSSGNEGKVVQLDSGGQIPVGYLPDPDIQTSNQMVLEIADMKNAPLNIVDGYVDPFDSDTIGSTSTNETYDASADYYHSSSNMTLISAAYTASSAPIRGSISVSAQFVDSSTVNTDFKAEISRDNGTTYTAITLTAGAVNDSFTLYFGEADISSQPSGTSVKYRITTLNNKNIRVSGVVVRWS